MEALPKVLPVNELKNTANILKICKESDGPIIITRNGYGEAVMMSLEVYEDLYEQVQLATLAHESLLDLKNGETPVNGKEFMDEMLKKYGKWILLYNSKKGKARTRKYI